MKLRYICLPFFLIIAGIATAGAQSQPAGILLDPDRTFSRAAEAYDEGDYAQALELYAQMIQAGYDHRALRFNLGNTLYRLGKPGHAIVQFRRAWRDAPRDPDILTNLAHVQRQTGAIPHQLSFFERVWSQLSPGEWAFLATVGWWLGALLLALSFHDRKRRQGLRKCAIACGLLLLVSAPGVQYWRSPTSTQEAVVVGSGYQAKFAPLQGAQAHFDVPQGTIVRVREEAQGWFRIALNEKSGWLPKAACTMVLEEGAPWTDHDI